MKRYVGWLWALVILLLPGIGLAAENFFGPWDAIQNLTFVPPASDLSMRFLAKLFGAVPGVPQLASGGVTIIGPVFSIFNAGLLALSGIFLGYTTYKTVTETAMDGSTMSKPATIFTALRVALSTSLLVPQEHGYSAINGIIMWMVVQSIGLADATWKTALNYLGEQGNAFTVTPQKIIDYTLINYITDYGAANPPANLPYADVGAADVLRSLVCVNVLQQALIKSQERVKSKPGSYPPDLVANTSKDIYSVVSTYNDDTVNKVIRFPYIADSTSLQAKSCGLDLNSTNNTPLLLPDLTGVCGEIHYDTSASSYAQDYENAKKVGLDAMVDSLYDVANELVDRAYATTNNTYHDNVLNPTEYVLFQSDSGANVTLIKPTSGVTNITDPVLAAFSSPRTQQAVDYYVNPADSNQTGFAQFDSGAIPDIKWPLGTYEMLDAAGQYQNILEPVMTKGSAGVTAEVKKMMQQAISKGWLASGGYYNLLRYVSNVAGADTTYYKLKAYDKGNSREFSSSDVEYKTWRSGIINSYNSFFKLTDIKNVLAQIDNSNNQFSSSDNLARVLTWVYFATPYAHVLANVLVPPTALPEKENIATFDVYSSKWTMNWGRDEATLWGQFAVGCFLMATAYIPFAGVAAIGAIPILMDIPTGFLQLSVDNVIQKWRDNMLGTGVSNKDPILKLQELGDKMMDEAFGYFNNIKYFYLGVTVANMLPAFIVQVINWCFSPGSYWGITQGVQHAINASIAIGNMMQNAIQIFISMNVPLGLALMGPMFITGATLSIYLPLIPYMLYLFGIISWFISVLVVMAAAPIICFLMMWGAASQENPLLSREGEQFLMQLIGVFFRPTLMVMGLIAGVALSYIGVDVLNVGFVHVYNQVVTPGGEGTASMMKQIGFVVIYTFTMISVVNMCFSTIHLLYSETMRIAQIQAPAVGMEEKHMEAVKAGAMEFAHAGVAGAKEQATALKGAKIAPESKQADKTNKEKTKGATTTQTGTPPTGGEGGEEMQDLQQQRVNQMEQE